MKRSVGRLCMLALVLMASEASGAAIECTVADPTGTPLNVRDAPNGRVVATLANGTRVRETEERHLNGKRWSAVSAKAGAIGWVFSAYLDCAAIIPDEQKSAPMRPRPTGN